MKANTGNDYFSLWLGETMAYSCAMWDGDEENQSLDDAQLRKIEYHALQAHARDAGALLDIGCGWGGLLNHVVSEYDVARAVGLTLSQSQADWITSRARPGVEVRLESWENHQPDTLYDSIISIGAFEHFAKLGLRPSEKVRIYRNFFSHCHGWLKSRGWMSLQTVAYGNSLPRDFDEFIAREIFPETDTPRLAELVEGAERLFEIVSLRNDRDHYRRTLRAWFSNLKSHRMQAVRMKGEEEVRRFEQYLRLMAYMFEVGGLDLYRVTLRKIDRPRGS
jgi:cyclopropane-fatty-acyl-phospholipid synthase